MSFDKMRGDGDVSYWLNIFKKAIAEHNGLYADRSGALPIHKMGLDKLLPGQRKIALDAIAQIIDNLQKEPEEQELKGILAAVNELTKNYESTPILHKLCYEKLFKLGDSARPYMLRILIYAGYKLTPEDLEDKRVKSVKDKKPIDWYDAAVLAGYFDMVCKEIQNDLSSGKQLYPPLDGWQKMWPDSSDFLSLAQRWAEMATDEDTTDYIKLWLELNNNNTAD